MVLNASGGDEYYIADFDGVIRFDLSQFFAQMGFEDYMLDLTLGSIAITQDMTINAVGDVEVVFDQNDVPTYTFVNEQKYLDEDGSPMIYVIGDSDNAIFSVEASDCVVSFNTLGIKDGAVGVQAVVGTARREQRLRFDNVVISENAVGVEIGSNAIAEVGRSIITNNGIGLKGNHTRSSIAVYQSEIIGNFNPNGTGGGISSYGFVTLSDVELSGNVAEYGGAIFANNLSADRVYVHDNKAEEGSAFYLTGSGIVANSIFNSLIVSNAGGYAIHPIWGADVNVVNSTVVDNNINGMGDACATDYASVNFYNSIVAINDGSEINVQNGGVISADASLSKYPFEGNNYLYYDQPLFEDDGYTLAPNSVAIDRGNNDYVVDYPYDIVGNDRLQGTSVDIGAFETYAHVEAPSLVVTTPYDVVDEFDHEISLREAVGYAQPGETITFAASLSGQTLVLGSELLVDKSVSIDGGDNGITLSGGGKVRVIRFLGADTDEYTVSNLTITQGATTSGAGVYVAAGTANIVNCAVVSNKSTTSGGGVYVAGAGAATITNTLIAENSAKYGGGLFAYGRSGKSVVVTNTTITNNTATTNGSGLFTETADGTVEIRNSIIALNKVKSDVYKKASGRVITAHNSLSTYANWSNGSANNIVYDAARPLFVGLGDYTLAQGSQAINSGANIFATVDVDLVGNPRIVGSSVDMGAYELQRVNETPSTIVTTALDIVDPEDNLVSLREAIAYANAGETVTFDAALAGRTIVLGSELIVDKTVSIDGGGNNITLSGDGQVRVIRFLGADSDAYVVSNLTITKGAYTSGAGVYVASGTVDIVNCSVIDNVATTSGGGVYVAGAGAANIVNTLIAENSAKYGGGLFVYGRTGKSVIVTNTTIANNKATTNGAGLFMETADGTFEIRNSIIALNTVKSDVYKKSSSRSITAFNTLSTFTGWTNGISANVIYDASQPLFVGAGNYALAQRSQAFNKGDNSYVSIEVDLAGESRIVGAAVDLGAFELQASNETPSTVVTTTLDVVDATDGLISLREAIAYAIEGEVITFDASLSDQTITLTSELLIEKNISLDGEDNCITLSGGGKTRALRFNGGATGLYAISNLTIVDGYNERGAGIYVATGAIEIFNSSIVRNTSTVAGGGIYIAGAGSAKIVNTLVANNTANYGGGIYSMGAAGNSVVLTNCTVVANRASTSGAGLHTESGYGAMEIRNSIIALNTGKPDVQKRTSSRVIKAYNTLSSFTNWSSGSSSNLVYNASQPLFVGDDDYALALGSQALDKGSDHFVTLATDLSGGARVVGAAVDLGAYELQVCAESPSTIVTTAEDVVDETDGLISLREALAYASIGDTVTFDNSLVDQTITLTSELAIDKSVAIDGGDNRITLSGGGKVRVLYFAGGDSGEYRLSHLTITQGSFTSGAGAYVASGKAIIVNCSVVGNKSTKSGGGIYVAGTGELELVNSLVANNSAQYGGGVFVYGKSGKSIIITNATISNNSASNNGAGLFTETAYGTIEIRNSIITLNIGKPDVYKKTSSRVVRAFNTLSPYTNWSSGSRNNLTYDAAQPLFVGVDDYTLAIGSQAHDVGDVSFITSETDLSGDARVVGATVDLGAYELQTTCESPSTLVTTAADVIDETDGLISLREALGYAQSGARITFASSLAGQTLTLTEELAVNKSVEIDGGRE